MLLHATSIVIDGQAVLLTGPSGSGKSDLALRLIDAGAVLLSDDQTELFIAADGGGALMARAPVSIAGLIEVRHVGLMRLPYVDAAPIAVQVDLSGAGAALPRLPEPETTLWLGKTIVVLRLPAFENSTPAKIRFWLRHGVTES